MPLLDRLCTEHSLRVGDNEPYSGALHNDTMYRHGTQCGLAHALIEIRNDLIATPAGIQEWADRLAPILLECLQDQALNRVQHFGSHSDL
jgi:predicted N-formylglutamate amidohydrolase